MRLVHPFGEYVPHGAKYLTLGSFPGKEVFDPELKGRFNWYYSTKTNQFWPILEKVYKRELKTIDQKRRLFDDLKMAIGDVIYKCERERGSNLDVNLINIEYNQDGIQKVLENNLIEKIFFTSRWVEKIYGTKFKKLIETHPLVELITLPCPSPRYFRLTINQKIERYKEVLPKLKI